MASLPSSYEAITTINAIFKLPIIVLKKIIENATLEYLNPTERRFLNFLIKYEYIVNTGKYPNTIVDSKLNPYSRLIASIIIKSARFTENKPIFMYFRSFILIETSPIINVSGVVAIIVAIMKVLEYEDFMASNKIIIMADIGIKEHNTI